MGSLQRGAALTSALGLVLAVRVATADPLATSFDTQGTGGDEGNTFNQGPDPVPVGVMDTPPSVEGVHSAAPNWLFTAIEWLVYLVVIGAVLAVLGWVVLRLLGALRSAPQVPVVERSRPGVPVAVLADAEERTAQLREGEPSDSVIRCWASLERALLHSGVRPDPARTPAETVQAALRRHDVDIAALDRLATLYRVARFSEHDLTEADRSGAAEALDRIHADLRAATGSAATSGGGRR